MCLHLNDEGHEEIEGREGPLYQVDYEGNKRSNMAQSSNVNNRKKGFSFKRNDSEYC